MIKRFFQFIKSLLLSGDPPKWRLVPDQYGTYTLEKYHYDIDLYLAEVVQVLPGEADGLIEKLERSAMYYTEEKESTDEKL